ncbi:zinc-ribbon domain-containing protein [Acidimangrovimonas sediminis]|uniref:zinc-ribbon domain-containing protein n=1 Tax=Acidimangrovimonas sediminis TaxID=2056283 RepID=UPI000C7FB745|nr:zinc-ribbon domain-containing protein [Acidimangrovimonas sediminis]
MRLTCPNCDAQYEVDDTAIPDGGRDVQCSNCGHAWFQLHPDVEEQLRDEARAFGDAGVEAPAPSPAAPSPTASSPVAPEPTEITAAIPESSAEPAPAIGAYDDAETTDAPPAAPAEPAAASVTAGLGSIRPPVPEDDVYDDDDDTAPLAAPRPAASPRQIDDGLKQLLREEAQRESTARKAEATPIESQPDLGLDDSAPRPAPSRPARPESETGNRIEKVMAEEKAAAARSRATIAAASTGDVASGPRRDLLPDIEEINSTLRASTERERTGPGASTEAETPAEQRRNFRRGFLVVLLIAVILALIYLYAPKIAQRVPALSGPLQTYVHTVDKGRIWMDRMMTRATHAIQGKPAGGSAPSN